MKPLVEVQDLSKRFGATQALNQASLSVYPGQVHCLLGENGAGKSTLGKVLAGLVTADKGRILFEGQEITNHGITGTKALGVTLAYQELSLVDDLNVSENLNLGLEKNRSPWSFLGRTEELQSALEKLELFDLGCSPTTAAGRLSAGQRQMLEVAKALMGSPRLVILDEPTATLNAIEKQKLFAVLKDLKKNGTAFVLVTHHIEDVLEIGDYVTLLRNGEVVDSFALTPQVTEEDLLEKLCGKRNLTKKAEFATDTKHAEQLLKITGLTNYVDEDFPVEIPAGSIVALYGVEGCGNEHIARALVGVEKSRQLTFSLRGQNHTPSMPFDSLLQGISYLPPKRSECILPERSVRENMNLNTLNTFSKLGWLDRVKEKASTYKKIKDFDIRCNSEEIEITSLSGGNQQKVFIARVLSKAKTLVVLEEPTAGIDIGAKLAIHEVLREAVRNTGLGILLVSSDINEVLALSDVVYTMFRGKIMNCYRNPTEHDQAHILADILGDYVAQQQGLEQGVAV